MLSMGGVVAGFSALLPVLYSERIAANVCLASENSCRAQYLFLNLMFTVSMFASDAIMSLYGIISDRKGPRTAFSIGLALTCAAYAMMGIGSELKGVWFVSFLLLGLAGPGIVMGCLCFGEMDPELQTVMSAVSASMWDSSSVIFLLFWVLYEVYSWSIREIFWGWGLVCILVGVPTLYLLPSHEQITSFRKARAGSPTNQDDQSGVGALQIQGGQDCSIEVQRSSIFSPIERGDSKEGNGYKWAVMYRSRSGTDDVSEASPLLEPTEGRGGGEGSMCGLRSIIVLLSRRDTVLLLFFMVVCNLKYSFYIATFSKQLARIATTPIANSAVNLAFNIAFPVGGFCSCFASTAVLTMFKHSPQSYFLLIICLALVHAVANLIQSLEAQVS
jgi:MFS family permease